MTPYPHDTSMTSHYSFFMGDLNFRTKLPLVEAGSPEHIKACHDLVALRDWETLNQHDELSKALAEKKCLVGWKTPYCNFDPTFKVARQNGYSYNPVRSPSYTDRILFKTGDQLEEGLNVALYEPISSFTSSDHKPVRGAFEVKLNSKFEIMSDKISASSHTLHILVTSIECQINETEYISMSYQDLKEGEEIQPPKPFVSFVSTPSEILEIDKSEKKKSSWKRFGLKRKSKDVKKQTKSETEKKNPLSKYWPGTKVLPRTFDAKYANEEVHFEVQTRNLEDGSLLDLSGALLLISLFHDSSSGDPKLLGSSSLNLASMIQTSQQESQDSNATNNSLDWGSRHERHIMRSKDATQELTLEDRRAAMKSHKFSSRRMLSGPSTKLLSLIEDADELCENNAEHEKLKNIKVTSMEVDEVLIDSGKEIGQIKCTIDSWWMENEIEVEVEEDPAQKMDNRLNY